MIDQISILVAEDDPDDQFFLAEAFKSNDLDIPLQFLNNGDQLIKYANSLITGNNHLKYPVVILLDMNMPFKNGVEVLQELKSHPVLKKIPVIMLSTTNSEREMKYCYKMGAHAYITKPNSFGELVQIVSILYHYVLEISTLGTE